MQRKKIYFPFLTVINDRYRYYAPLHKKQLEMLVEGKIIKDIFHTTALGTIRKDVRILPITYKNYSYASQCTATIHCRGCDEKIKMYRTIREEYMGFMNMDGETLLGGAEWYPSLSVPYDIPKNKDTALITCVYLSDSKFDYKTGALEHLENYLSQKYSKVIVISDEAGVFPNGDLNFFLQNGYCDERVVFEDDYCKLHLMSKQLK